MLFNSFEFFIFLPLILSIYWLPWNEPKYKNLILLVGSYVFYGWWDWRFLFLIAFSTGVDFILGIRIEKSSSVRTRKKYLMASLLANLGILGFFKYYNFFIDSFINVFSIDSSQIFMVSIILPIGISFYTFQTLSYTIDIYKCKLRATNDFIAFSAFIAFFPQLVAGPIERASNLLPQFLSKRKINYKKASDGIFLIVWGFFKKIVIADNIALYVDAVYGNFGHHSGKTLLLASVLFGFQIYTDFSGYSDIARGVARLFGIELMKNFNVPYYSRSLKEFWSRWHISLSTWFRDYVYIPLGGSKGTTLWVVVNLLITFILSGLWHGANWTFVLWGFVHFLGLVSFKVMPKFLKGVRVFSFLITFGFVMVAWVFFRSNSVEQSITILEKIVGFKGAINYLSLSTMATIGIGLIILFFVDYLLYTGKILKIIPQAVWAKSIILSVVISFILLVGNLSSSQFIYFQF